MTRPRLSAATVPRPRLEALLDGAANHRLIVVESPSGFGKTTLVSAWAQRLSARGELVPWLTLDEYDDEPARFMSYLWAAMQTALPALGDSAEQDDAGVLMLSTYTLLSRLLQAMCESTAALHLFIDGYHFLTRPQLHGVVRYLLRLAPPGFQLVLTSCAELPFSTVPWRAAGELLEIDARLLGFDLEETRALSEKMLGAQAEERAVRQLHQTTGGWAAALRIALQGVNHPGGGLPAGATARHLGEYLTLIWDGLSESLRDFMLKTSMLDRLCAPVCELLSGRNDAREMLEMIARKHLLLTPLEESDTWYGYHALMAEYLRKRMLREQPGLLQSLHRKASAWFALNGLWTQAIRHAIEAEDLAQAAAMFECCAIEKVRAGDLLTVIGWYRRFPAEVTCYQPRVRLALAWAHLLAGREAEAEAMLEAVNRELLSMQNADALAAWECGVLRAASAAIHDDSEQSLRLGLTGLSLEKMEDPWIADAAGNAVRFGHVHAARFKAAQALPWYSDGAPTDVRSAYPAYFRRLFLAVGSVKQLQLREARRHIDEIDQITQCHFGQAAFERLAAQALAAEIRYLQGDLETAREVLSDCLAMFDDAHALPPLDAALCAGRTIIRLSLNQGQPDRALAHIDRIIDIGQAHRRPRLMGLGLYEQLRIRLLQGDIADAEACLERLGTLAATHPAPQRCAWTDLHDHYTLGQSSCLIHRGETARAVALLMPLTDEARRLGYSWLHVIAGGALVRALQAQGELPAARALLSELQTLTERSQAVQLLTDAMALPGPIPAANSDSGPAHALVSPRELDVLHGIACGLSNKQIARQFDIAPETVKTYVKRIFVKLDISRRSQAVAWLKAPEAARHSQLQARSRT